MSEDTRDADMVPAADFTAADEPFAIFEQWLAEAERTEPNDPNAMALATADADGLPNVRMVLLKGLDPAARGADRGFVFYTNLESAKGRELAASGKAALLFHWKSLRRQVRVRGTVATVSAAEADAYFATRARGSRLGPSGAAPRPPPAKRRSPEEGAGPRPPPYPPPHIPRPPHWSGFRVTPVSIELWHDRPFRLHDRVVFRRGAAGEAWEKSRLYP